EIPLSRRQLGLRRHAVRLGAGATALLLGGLETRQDLTGPDTLSLPHVHADQVALETGAYVDALDRAQIAGDGNPLFDDVASNRCDIARGERDGRRDTARSGWGGGRPPAARGRT